MYGPVWRLSKKQSDLLGFPKGAGRPNPSRHLRHLLPPPSTTAPQRRRRPAPPRQPPSFPYKLRPRPGRTLAVSTICTSCTLSSRSEVYFPDLPVDKPYFVIRDYWNNEWTEGDVLSLAAGVESNTNHPLGKAIMEAAQAANCIDMKVLTADKSEIKRPQYANCIDMKAKDGSFMEEPGSGAVATIGEKQVSVGTLDWIRRHGVVRDPFREAENFGQSVAYVAVDGTLAGLICFEDKIREDSHQVISALSKQGISVYMLSGDKESAAMNVAAVVGIQLDKVISEVKPHEKKKFISELQKEHKLVAMVGDGINDAAALALADVGIAMGGGVGAASDVSSVVLMGNRLSQLVDALELSKETMKTVKQNLWWAFLYNIVGLPVAAGALLPVTGTMLTPSIAGALMGFSSVSVMANSLLLRARMSSRQQPTHHVQSRQKPHNTISGVSDGADEVEQSYPSKWRST